MLIVVAALWISTPLLRAQNSKIAIVDFERAVVECNEGKKASEKFNATLQAKQAEVEKKKKDLDDQEKKLQAQERTLSDTAKANLQRDIERRTLELQRLQEDAQKELQSMRDEMLRPIAEKATAVLNAMSEEQAYTLVVDLSNPQNNVVWFNKKNDVTDELIRRIDTLAAKTTEAPKTAVPGAPAASTPTRPLVAPSTTPRTTPATQPPATAPKKP